MARVLVGYGTKMGGTAEIAEQIGSVLSERGHDVTVTGSVKDDPGRGYDGAVIGSALYNGGWRGEAVAMVRRAARAQNPLPVWLFHSGPLGDDEAAQEQPLPGAIAKHLGALDVRGTITFGGRLPEDANGFIARAMVRNGRAGDWRDLDGRVTAWAREIADSL